MGNVFNVRHRTHQLANSPSDFADEHPDAEIIGTDLSPIQPVWVPPNVKFELEDATNSWTWPDNHFDFVHIRFLIGAIADWGALFKEAYRCCSINGYIESAEVNPTFCCDDGSIENAPVLQTWNKLYKEGSRAFGRSFCDVENDVQLLGDAGFVDVHTADFKVGTFKDCIWIMAKII
jgi:ubiquinone/menaquinone biosynthesis C-methylase UbiE